jgi:hypothetical protein
MTLDLKAIRERANAATKGPWVRDYIEINQRKSSCSIVGNVSNGYNTPVCRLYCGFVTFEADVEFIAHSRQDIPALCDEVERLQRIVDEYQKSEAEKLKAMIAQVKLEAENLRESSMVTKDDTRNLNKHCI